MTTGTITVVGSINLDFVATAAKLPVPGETVTNATLARHPGGKGANQALAARRLGASVRLIGRVGADGMADEALAWLRRDGVDLAGVTVDTNEPTGVALIAVSASGENQIIVASGANGAFVPDLLAAPVTGALICQLELPFATIAKAVATAAGFVCVNLAPAHAAPVSIFQRANLIVVNELEAAVYGDRLHATEALIAITFGAKGASLFQHGKELARAAPPSIIPIDTTGAGDAFVAALTIALLEDMPRTDALAFACAAGAVTATRPGAQTSLPTRAEVETLLHR